MRLSQMTKDEFYDVAKECKPGLTRQEFDVMWDEFQRDKAMYELHCRGMPSKTVN